MPNAIQSIIRKATRKQDEPLNILLLPTHERYESSLAETGHNFYAINVAGGKKWNETYAKVPDNYHILPESYNEITVYPWLDFDCIISQHKSTQFELCNAISKRLQIPLISMEHMLPNAEFTPEQAAIARTQLGDINVFVSEYQKEQWGYDGVVNPTGIDTEVFKPKPEIQKEEFCLTVVNNFIKRDAACGFTLWKEITGFPNPTPIIPYRLLGNTPGLSQPAPDIETLVSFYNASTLYLNTTIVSSLPTVMLESMACGTPCVSTDTCLIPHNIIEHGVNGFVGKNVREIQEYSLALLKNKNLAKKMGKEARKTILEKFSKERFVQNWNDIFNYAIKKGRKGEK